MGIVPRLLYILKAISQWGHSLLWQPSASLRHSHLHLTENGEVHFTV